MPDDRPAAPPVFVDPTGRRRRTIRTTAVLGACSLLGVTGLIVAALLGAPLGPLNPLPDPASGPPAAVEPVPARQPAATPGEQPTTTTGSRRGDNRVVGPGVTTTTPPGAAPTTMTTTTTKGNKPTAPPGKPTDLPTPPGHTR